MEEEKKLTPLEFIKDSVENLRTLNTARTEISRKLAGLSSKYKLRKEVIGHLYDYYEMIADDYYGLVEGAITSYQVAVYMRDTLKDQEQQLTKQLEQLTEILNRPVKITEVTERLEKITSHVYYMKDILSNIK